MSASRSSSPVLALAFLTIVFAGCVGDEPANPEFVATASGGVLFRGWDYGAETLTEISGNLDVDVNEETNTGTVRAGGRMGNQTITVLLEEFVHNADDFHSGGIAANFDEHGDSGVGNALLPRMHLLLATWGPGQVLIDGNATIDPYTGSDVWDAHLMVTSTGVRTDGMVRNSDGSGPYDPADPGNAQIGDDLEAHLVLSSTANGSLEPINETFQGSVDAPAGTTVHPFEVPIAAGEIVIQIDIGQGPEKTGRFAFTLFDPDGTGRGSLVISNVVPGSPTSGEIVATVDKAGPWRLQARSQATPFSYTADVNVTFPPKPMYYFFYEDVNIEERVTS